MIVLCIYDKNIYITISSVVVVLIVIYVFWFTISKAHPAERRVPISGAHVRDVDREQE